LEVQGFEASVIAMVQTALNTGLVSFHSELPIVVCSKQHYEFLTEEKSKPDV